MRKFCGIWFAGLVLATAVAMVQASPIAALTIVHIEFNNEAGEIIVLFNPNPFDVDLTGYRIWSEGEQEFTFGESAVNPQDPVIRAFDVVRVHSIHCQVFEDARDFNWINKDGSCKQVAVWNNITDVARLFPPEGNAPIATFSYP